ncbi:MAG: RteC domain-containing protein [Flavobacteriaceae bacterium]|nr:RteC domain-containing protein [Flavobacteriaceae bacterium]
MITSFYNEALTNLEYGLNTLERENNNVVERSELAIKMCLKSIDELKLYFGRQKIYSQEEEVDFFKEIKPLFVAKLVYYIKLYNIEASLVVESPKIKKNIYALELKKVKSFLNQNKVFYKYYKTNCTHLDHKYFVRGNQDIKLQLQSNTFEFDSKFSTSNDFLVAKIKASEKLQIYLENKITPAKLGQNNMSTPSSNNEYIKWTGSKVALIELIYALHTAKVINKGETGIKGIANLVSDVFNVDLGDYYRTYAEIRMRKTGRTKFLDKLKAQLIIKMEASDEEY